MCTKFSGAQNFGVPILRLIIPTFTGTKVKFSYYYHIIYAWKVFKAYMKEDKSENKFYKVLYFI